ncbi:probable G-protein coupled receptor No18 [Clytia hemisphaerica]|uniref:probable G-protein coupled receptor No18 n=1 Tax=Clytia hemisphaerica TaxID=252671 RepID=UPI0034D4802C
MATTTPFTPFPPATTPNNSTGVISPQLLHFLNTGQLLKNMSPELYNEFMRLLRNQNMTLQDVASIQSESPSIPTLNLSTTFSNMAAIFFIMIIIISVSCNTLLIYIIVKVKSLHTIMHVFIINLAISDLITSAATMPFDVDLMLTGSFNHSKIACGFMHFTFLISLPSSVLNLVLLTTERFISVVFPFQRIRYLKKRNVIIMLITTWVYTFSVALYPLIYKPGPQIVFGRCVLIYPIAYDIFNVVTNFSLPVIYICFANFVLFFIANRHAIRIKTLTMGSFVRKSKTPDNNNTKDERKQSDESIESVDENKKSPGSRSTTQNKRRGSKGISRKLSIHTITMNVNMRAVKKLALLVGVFLFCWLTYIIIVAKNLSCQMCVARELVWIGNIINYSSSAVNPVLYGLMNSTIRREIKKPFRQLYEKYFSPIKTRSETLNRRRSTFISAISEDQTEV